MWSKYGVSEENQKRAKRDGFPNKIRVATFTQA